MTVYYKMRQILLQNATTILLQNATEVYYKMHQVFLLKNATVLLQNETVITNCDNIITKSELLKNVTFITNCDSTLRLKYTQNPITAQININSVTNNLGRVRTD